MVKIQQLGIIVFTRCGSELCRQKSEDKVGIEKDETTKRILGKLSHEKKSFQKESLMKK